MDIYRCFAHNHHTHKKLELTMISLNEWANNIVLLSDKKEMRYQDMKRHT